MDVGSILLIMALAVLVGLYISRPFFGRQPEEKLVKGRTAEQEKDHLRSALLAEHERALTALQELEFDYTLGKIPEEDYPAQRALLLRNGANALRQLDEMEPAGAHSSAEDRIEAAVAARRTSTGPAANTEDDLENLIASRRRKREESSAGFCPKCGKPVQKSDLFCPRCGAKTAA